MLIYKAPSEQVALGDLFSLSKHGVAISSRDSKAYLYDQRSKSNEGESHLS